MNGMGFSQHFNRFKTNEKKEFAKILKYYGVPFKPLFVLNHTNRAHLAAHSMYCTHWPTNRGFARPKGTSHFTVESALYNVVTAPPSSQSNRTELRFHNQSAAFTESMVED